MMKQLISVSFFMLCFLVFNAQNSSQSLSNKYLGIWISNDENKKFILNIDKDSIRIENGGKIIHRFTYHNNANRFWIKYSNTETIDLVLTDNNKLLWLDYKMKNIEYPISVPEITTVQYVRYQ